MMNFWIVTAVAELIIIIALGAMLIRFLANCRKATAALSHCRAEMDRVDDTDAYLAESKQKLIAMQDEYARLEEQHHANIDQRRRDLEQVDVTSRNKLDEIAGLDDKRKSLTEVITKYQQVVGDFKSAAKLRHYVGELQQLVGKYKSAADLETRINEQKAELKTYADAMGVAADAREIVGKAEYYQNLVDELKAEVESIEGNAGCAAVRSLSPPVSF